MNRKTIDVWTTLDLKMQRAATAEIAKMRRAARKAHWLQLIAMAQ